MTSPYPDAPVSRAGKPVLRTRGHEAFRRGTMGNGGQNLYVSRAGVLQRIFQFDLNRNGYIDLVFCNSQGHWERPPTYVYPCPLTDPPHRIPLPEEGARGGAVADLNGDGYDDIILGNHYGGITLKQNSFIYYGAASGLNQRYHPELPAPCCTAVAAGDFNGNGKPDLVFLTNGSVRLFYQRPFGFEPKRYQDLPIEADQVEAADLDGDGCAELLVRAEDGQVRIFWGGPAGFDKTRRTSLPSHHACDVALGDLTGEGRDAIVLCQNKSLDSFTTESLIFLFNSHRKIAPEPVSLPSEDARRAFIVHASDNPLPQVVLLNHFSRGVCGDVDVTVYHGGPDRFFPDRKMALPAFGAVEALCCDINDDGFVDLVIPNCAEHATNLDPGSFVYLNGPTGFDARGRITLPTTRAHGVCCADLNRNGYLDLIFGGFSCDELLVFYGSEHGYDRDHLVRIRMEHEGVVYDDPRWIYLADFNNNGWLDLVVPQISHDRSFILWGGPEGFSMDRCQPLSVFHGVCAHAADLS